MHGEPFDLSRDPALGRELRALLDAGDATGFTASVLARLPERDSLWHVLAGWARPGIAAALVLGVEKQLKCYVIDATAVARDTGMSGRINTIMQTCFFALSGVLLKEEAIAQIKQAIQKTYSKKGASVVDQNFKTVDATLAHLYEVNVPAKAPSTSEMHIGSS